jgi:aspartate racemase
LQRCCFSCRQAKILRIIERLQVNGAEGIVLGCTEIGMLIQQKDVKLPVFDTTRIHAERAAMKALGM